MLTLFLFISLLAYGLLELCSTTPPDSPIDTKHNDKMCYERANHGYCTSVDVHCKSDCQTFETREHLNMFSDVENNHDSDSYSDSDSGSGNTDCEYDVDNGHRMKMSRSYDDCEDDNDNDSIDSDEIFVHKSILRGKEQEKRIMKKVSFKFV